MSSSITRSGRRSRPWPASPRGKTVAELRQAFGKYAEVEHIKTFGPADLDIFKEENQVVVAFAYEKRIPLAGNVSLLIDFSGSSSGAVTGNDRLRRLEQAFGYTFRDRAPADGADAPQLLLSPQRAARIPR
jgi:hypothetical protein